MISGFSINKRRMFTNYSLFETILYTEVQGLSEKTGESCLRSAHHTQIINAHFILETHIGRVVLFLNVLWLC